MRIEKHLVLAGLLVVSLGALARSEFVPPTSEQVKAAATDPAQLAGLLTDADAEQAASVVKVVIAEIVSLRLSPETQSARIASVVSGAFATVPAALSGSFASALGRAVAGSPVITATPGAVSTIQVAVASAGGGNGGALAQAFAAAFESAKQTNTATDADPSQISPPPVATGYEGQTL